MNQTDPTAETARALLHRHGLPEDVIDGVFCLHAQELAAAQRADAAVWGTDTAAGQHRLAAADLIDPTKGAASAVVAPPTDRAAEELASLAVNAGRALHDEKRHYEIACQENARLRATIERVRRLHDALDAETDLTSPDDEITRGAAARKIAAALDGWTDPAELHRLAAEAQQQTDTETRLAKVERWVTSEVVTAKTEFGDGYRAALRDVRDVIRGRYDYDPMANLEPAPVVQQPAAVQPVRHAPGTAILCPDCRAKGHAVCMADEEPESCAHCGKDVQRISGTLTVWWVHDPGGNTICFPERAGSSPRATPKAAAVPEQPAAADEEAQFGVPGCTCKPWTTEDGKRRFLEPGETVDRVSGWHVLANCPHHKSTEEPRP